MNSFQNALESCRSAFEQFIQSPDYILLGAVLAGLSIVFALLYVTWRVRFWWREGQLLRTTPGHATPPTTLPARLTRAVVSNLFRRRYVGPLKVLGKEHLKYRGRLIILLNHQTERDAIIVPSVLGLRHTRALMAATQIYGIRTPLAAWAGIIAVHHDRSPAASIRASIHILQREEHSSFIAFPQGALKKDNQLKRGDFFDGTMMISKMTARKSKTPVAVLPAAIAYDRDPGHATLLQRCFEFPGWKTFRSFFGDVVYGAGIAFGEPIEVSDLPGDYGAAMDVVFEHICALSDEIHRALDIEIPPRETPDQDS